MFLEKRFLSQCSNLYLNSIKQTTSEVSAWVCKYTCILDIFLAEFHEAIASVAKYKSSSLKKKKAGLHKESFKKPSAYTSILYLIILSLKLCFAAEFETVTYFEESHKEPDFQIN